MKKNFLKKLQNFIFQEKFLKRGEKIIVGISGGSDSVGLALALIKLQFKYLLKLQFIHINYHQRGEESEEDEKFVKKFAEENKVALKVFDYKEKIKGNLEEQMRDFRYKKFEEVRKDLNFDKIAVAHHADDQAETFLMNLLRGAGLKGLSGMKVKRGFLIRPFLFFSKEDILEFLEENKQKYRVDKTNLKSDFTRNKIRLELIPFLEEKFNLKVRDNLGKLTKNLQDENQLNDFFVNKIWEDLVKEESGKIILDSSKFKKIPIGGQKRIFREIILKLKGNLKNITTNNFKEFKKIIDSQKSKKKTMNMGKIVLEKSVNCAIFIKN